MSLKLVDVMEVLWVGAGLWALKPLASLHSSKVGPWLSLIDVCPVRGLRKKLHLFLFSKASKYMV